MPRAAARRRAIAEALLAEFERWGYDRIITPGFEYADVLSRGMGEDARGAALRFVEPATGEIVSLRPDITPQVARLVATRLRDVGGPIRLCYEGSVLRFAQGARGQRELIQAGVELIDAPSPEGDAEVIALATAALCAAGIRDITVDLGHIVVAKTALMAVEDPELRAELKFLVSKKDREQVALACARAKLPPRRRRILEALPDLHGDPGGVLKRARALPLDARVRGALEDLERAIDAAVEEGQLARLTVDLGEMRGFEYYTGICFSAYVPGVGDAVLRGGRYDDLVGRYGREARATGLAVDVEAIAQAEKQRGVPSPRAAAGILVVEKGPVRERAFRVARSLRAAGARVSVDICPRSGDEEVVQYAAGIGVRVALVLDGRKTRLLELTSILPAGVHGSAATVRPVGSESLAQAIRGNSGPLLREMGLMPAGRRRSPGQGTRSA